MPLFCYGSLQLTFAPSVMRMIDDSGMLIGAMNYKAGILSFVSRYSGQPQDMILGAEFWTIAPQYELCCVTMKVAASEVNVVYLLAEAGARILPPVFVAKPRSSVVKEGTTVTLDCAANGNPRPWLTWLKDGITIDMA